jgi:hypothetical protein
MLIAGCDFHAGGSKLPGSDTETGETGEPNLVHASGEAKQFMSSCLIARLIGMEAIGNSQWSIELVEDVGRSIWVGDAG